MAHVLGIDAAWTTTNPSGVALLSTEATCARLILAAPSFEDFVLRKQPHDWCGSYDFRATLDDVLQTARDLGAETIDVIAVDMPIARKPVRGRRECDQEISRIFGGRGCATHTPTPLRPGEVSDRFLHEAEGAGFELVTNSSERPRQALIEVYPHVAVLELCGSAYRISYKLARRNRYWRDKIASDRLTEIHRQWKLILAHLSRRVDLDLTIDCADRKLQFWKAWEDVIDAIVSGWVGVEWNARRAKPFGDAMAAIWVPERKLGG